MRVLVIENYPGTTLGLLAQVLDDAGVAVDLVPVHAGAPVPASEAGHDGLIVLGGVQNALDDANHPDLPHTVALIRAFAAADKAVLGICLGAQIVARAFGARNILGLPIEFGWREVEATAAGRADPVLSAMGASAHPFHWHTDTFDLPAGAVHLAKSAQTVNQGFRIGRAVYGIQFHFEADRDLVRSWCEAGHDDIAEHTPDWALRHARDSITHGVAAERVGRTLGEAWIRQITSG